MKTYFEELTKNADIGKPWWAVGGPHIMSTDGVEGEAGWVRWFSSQMGDDDFGAYLQRTTTFNVGMGVMTVDDEIVIEIEGQFVAFPHDRAADVIALIRAAVSVTEAHLSPVADETAAPNSSSC